MNCGRSLSSWDTRSSMRRIPRNIDYYVQRTSNGSTLSRVVHSWVLARSDRARSWQLFRQALRSDVDDIQGGTTEEGIHLGAMAGTVDLVQRAYSGFERRADRLVFNPCLPEDVSCLSLRLRYRGYSLDVTIHPSEMRIRVPPAIDGPVLVELGGRPHTLEPGREKLPAVLRRCGPARPASCGGRP